MKLPCCKNFYLDVNRKGIYFIWVRLKNRKAELEKLVKVNLAKHAGMFCREITATIKDLSSQTENYLFLEFQRIKKLPNTPLRCLNFSFSIQSHST